MAGALERLAGLPNVRFEDPEVGKQPLGWFAEGLDIAGDLHPASRGASEAFVTFDVNFQTRAGRLTELSARAL